MQTERELKRELVKICRMLHLKNFIAATDGNVSVKYGSRLLTTPSGVNKGFIEEDQIIGVDLAGRVVSGRGQPTSELAMHLMVYEVRPDVRAVIHAHPPLATAFSIAGVTLEEFVLPEVVMTMGGIPTTSYATPTTPDVPEVIRELIQRYDALILARHGGLTLGRDLMDAYNKMEKLEHTALVILTARQLGEVRLLPLTEVEKLTQMGGGKGLRAQEVVSPAFSGLAPPGNPDAGPGPEVDLERIVELIKEEVARHLAQGEAPTPPSGPAPLL